MEALLSSSQRIFKTHHSIQLSSVRTDGIYGVQALLCIAVNTNYKLLYVCMYLLYVLPQYYIEYSIFIFIY